MKVNTEAERELSSRFGIRSIPTIMIFKNGQVVDMLNGAVPKAPFDSWLKRISLILPGRILCPVFSSATMAFFRRSLMTETLFSSYAPSVLRAQHVLFLPAVIAFVAANAAFYQRNYVSVRQLPQRKQKVASVC